MVYINNKSKPMLVTFYKGLNTEGRYAIKQKK